MVLKLPVCIYFEYEIYIKLSLQQIIDVKPWQLKSLKFSILVRVSEYWVVTVHKVYVAKDATRNPKR